MEIFKKYKVTMYKHFLFAMYKEIKILNKFKNMLNKKIIQIERHLFNLFTYIKKMFKE